MALAKSSSQATRKITKVGGHSYYVTIPLDYIRELGWREHQKVQVTKHGKKIIIEDWEA
ncbi:AbrB/MazE/SpoVT family DNA-binding domain-containing protein [Candidatus Gracilibacteria bacterium]|nr:AbrB/MazE/SpoVT family DNA-binding domain-containing protein [Candidatus Gracilibacteria bacterium]